MQEKDIRSLADLILASVEILYNLRGDCIPKSAKDVDVQEAKEIIKEIMAREKLDRCEIIKVKDNLERIWNEREQTSPNSQEQIHLVKNALNSFLNSTTKDLGMER